VVLRPGRGAEVVRLLEARADAVVGVARGREGEPEVPRPRRRRAVPLLQGDGRHRVQVPVHRARLRRAGRESPTAAAST
jgi:hypothetical protein